MFYSFAGLKHEQLTTDGDGIKNSLISRNHYGKLSSETAPRQVPFVQGLADRLKSQSHPNLDLATPTLEANSKESYQLANGLAASLEVSTVPTQAGSTGITGNSVEAGKGNSEKPLNWNYVMRIAKEQNQKMYGSSKKKVQNKQDVGKADRALCCLSLQNPIRRSCIRIVEWK